MNPRILAAASLLLCATATGTIAENKAQLPDMSRALDVRIDGKMNDTLNRTADGTAERDHQAARPAVRGTERGATAASGRTDGSGWKPYHSAM